MSGPLLLTLAQGVSGAQFQLIPTSGEPLLVQLASAAPSGVLNAFMARKGTSQAFGAGFNTVTGWDVPILDTAGAFNAATGVYTCPATGIYQASLSLLFNVAAAPANSNFFAIVKQNATFLYDGEYPVQVAGTSNLQVAVPAGSFRANAGDQLVAQVLQTSGVSINNSAAFLSNYFAITQIQ